MKTSRLLNSELSYEISKIGHTAHISLCDAGFPIPKNVKRIDLAIEKGYPSFIKTLDVILSEMKVEEIIIASEIHSKNEKIFKEMMKTFKSHNMKPVVKEVKHEELKKISRESESVVRTGECTPYANVILKSGVIF